MIIVLLFWFVLAAWSAEEPSATPVEWAEIPAALRAKLGPAGAGPEAFETWREATRRETMDREREGENGHLIYYLLLSARFSERRPIDPVRSAKQFADRLSGEDRARCLADESACRTDRIPGNVRDRMGDLLRVLAKPTGDVRLQYLQQFLNPVPPLEREAYLARQYVQTMRVLARSLSQQGTSGGQQLANLAQEGGLSTDTQLESGYAVAKALEAIRAAEPEAKLNRALVVGPGLDFAPRADLIDLFPPQSYQPFALADRLLALGMSQPQQLQVHCVDINDRVVQFFRQAQSQPSLPLQLLLSVPDPGLQDYFRLLGDEIGSAKTVGLQKKLEVRPDLARRITADKLDVVVDRYEPSPQYDLVVATNILVYFEDATLLTAMTNIASMLRPGGYLIHNDLRPQVEEFSRGLGLPPVETKTIQIQGRQDETLQDAYVVAKRQ